MKLCYVLPCPAVNDAQDGLLGNGIPYGERGAWRFLPSIFLPDCFDNVGIKFRPWRRLFANRVALWVPGSRGTLAASNVLEMLASRFLGPLVSAFCNHIGSVALEVSNKKMPRIHARRIVALMADQQAVGDRPVDDIPRHAVRLPISPSLFQISFVMNGKISIAPTADLWPFPTFAWLAGGHHG